MREGILFFFLVFFGGVTSVYAQTYPSSFATTTNNSAVIGRVLFGEQPWSPDDILNPSEAGPVDDFPCTGYSDFTVGNSNPTDGNTTNSVYVRSIQKGFTYDLEVEGAYCGGSTNTNNKALRVFIDYNDDGDFEDAGEEVWTSPVVYDAYPTFNTSITIPMTATSVDDYLRMRIVYIGTSGIPAVSLYLGHPSIDLSDGAYPLGETEDYDLKFTGYIDTVMTDSALCSGGSDGVITIVPGVTAPVGVEYSIYGILGPWSTDVNYSGLSAGTYNVWARFQDDPNDPDVYTYEQYVVEVEEPDELAYDVEFTSDYNGSNISCSGITDGEITISNVVGGWTTNTNTTFQLTNSAGDITTQINNGVFQNLGAGDYTITVVDENSCESLLDTTLVEPDPVSFNTEITSDYNGEDVSCFGACDGEVTITPAGGTPGYDYVFNGVSEIDSVYSTACAGDLTIEVSDVNDCSITTTIILGEPTAVTVTTTVSDNNGYAVSCNGGNDGVITATGEGGVGSYIFSIDGGVSFTELNSTISGLEASLYDIVAQDANECVSAIEVTDVDEPSPLGFDPVTVDLAISCNGDSNGKITISANGGVPTYLYSLTGGAPYDALAGFNGLSAGFYDIAVLDANGCEHTEVFELTEPDPLQFSAAIISDYNGEDVSCYQGNDGEVLLTVTGGTEPYVYDLFGAIPTNPLLTSGVVSNLTAGTYTIMLSDDNDCPSSPTNVEVTLNQPEQLEITGVQVISDVSCYEETDGSLQVSAVGGTGNYTYIAGGNYPSGSQSTFTINNLAGGNYNVSVLDDNGCASLPYNVVIDEPAELVVTVVPTNLGCNGDDSGSASLNLTGGVPNFDYLWSDGQTTATATDLPAGSYSVLVTDANNCTGNADFTITQPELTTQAMSVNCFGASDGEIMVSIQDPNPASVYSYSWDDPSFQTTALAVSLMAGTYTVYVSDQFGCVLTATDSITQPDSLAVMVEHTNLCQDSPWAEAIVYASGGVEPYDYLWSTTEQTTQITIVNDGSYSVDVIDGNNCISVFDFIIDPMLPINIDFTVIDATCKDNVDGVIIPEITGGYPPFEFLWSNYATTAINADVGAGIYSVDITDSHGCSYTESAFVDADPSACLEVYSAFTPNGDENNDYWHIGQIELYPDAHVEVFNRWGERVFAGKNYTNTWEGGWTGMYNGKLLPSATYYYVITLNNEEEPYRGTVTIVR